MPEPSRQHTDFAVEEQETVSHESGFEIEELGGPDDQRIVRVSIDGVAHSSATTTYPVHFIEALAEVVGLDWLCDQIERNEDYAAMEADLELSLFSYFDREDFAGKRVLDFGCGTGASTALLSKFMPEARLVGTELDEERMRIAKLRMDVIGQQAEFFTAPSGTELNADLGRVDFIVLSAVYEHMLPDERATLLPKIWDALEPGGVLFLNQTPDVRFPFEAHTTGLPLVNYMPQALALPFSKLSKRVDNGCDWEALLRAGVRGGRPSTIIKELGAKPNEVRLLEPNGPGISRQSDIWYVAFEGRQAEKFSGMKLTLVKAACKVLKDVLRIPVAPYLSLAIQKI